MIEKLPVVKKGIDTLIGKTCEKEKHKPETQACETDRKKSAFDYADYGKLSLGNDQGRVKRGNLSQEAEPTNDLTRSTLQNGSTFLKINICQVIIHGYNHNS